MEAINMPILYRVIKRAFASLVIRNTSCFGEDENDNVALCNEFCTWERGLILVDVENYFCCDKVQFINC